MGKVFIRSELLNNESMNMQKKVINWLVIAVLVSAFFGVVFVFDNSSMLLLVSGDCGDGLCGGGENFENCLDDCDCFGAICLEQDVRLKTAYAYFDSMTESKIDELASHGINALIIKNGISNNINYTNYTAGEYENNLPDNVMIFAGFAKEKNLMLFEAFNYYHTVATSTITDSYVVYADGTAGPVVTAFDPVYWGHLTDIAVALANLSMKYPDDYRVDGMFLDLEIYGNERGSFNLDWGFEDSTFLAFVQAGGGYAGENPPIESGQRSERYGWLDDRDLLDDYYVFLEGMINSFGQELMERVKEVNPNFLIGAYPSPSDNYTSSLYAGWSNETEPCIIWATEPFSSRLGAGSLPSELDSALLSEGYYDFEDIYDDEIYGYYVGALSPYSYFSGDWAYHLYNVARETNGFWIWTTFMLTTPYEELVESYLPHYRVNCYNESENLIRVCGNAEEYAQSVADYYSQMDGMSFYLGEFLGNSSYDPGLSLTSPLPSMFVLPELVEAPEEILFSLACSDEVLVFDSPQLRLRGQHNFIVKANAGEEVEIGVKHVNVGGWVYFDLLTYSVSDQDGEVIEQGYVPSDSSGLIEFVSPSSGQYFISLNPGTSAFSILNSSAPIMLYENETISVFVVEGNVSFWVGDVENFSIYVSGPGTSEGFYARVYGPEDDLVDFGGGNATENWKNFEIDVSSEYQNKIWKLEILPPISGQVLEDVSIEFTGISPFFGLSDEPGFFMVAGFGEDCFATPSVPGDPGSSSTSSTGGDDDSDGTNDTDDNLTQRFILGGQMECKESWECSGWSECIDEKMTRDCYDENSCATENEKPKLEKGCGVFAGYEGLFLIVTAAAGASLLVGVILWFRRSVQPAGKPAGHSKS